MKTKEANDGSSLDVEALKEAVRSMPPAPRYLSVKDLKALLVKYDDDDGVVIAEGKFMIMKLPPKMGIPFGSVALSEPLMEENPHAKDPEPKKKPSKKKKSL